MDGMNKPLKNILRVGGVVVGLAAAAWALRDKLLPAPDVPDQPPPRFRTGISAAGDDDLTLVRGIGPVYAERLAAAGMGSFADLAAADVDEVTEAACVSQATAMAWVEQAAAMA